PNIRADYEEYAQDDQFPIKPQKLIYDLRQVMGPDDIVISDVGAHKMWIARHYHCHSPNTCIISNGFAAMGIAIPGALAAKLVYPNRKVVAATGDGGFMMNCQELPIALQCDPKKCDLILVFDDLDCRDVNSQREKFISAISKITESHDIPQYIAFAAPELESWMIGDWDNTIAKHPDFRGRHEKMRWWLSTQKNISFDDPESFSKYDQDRDCCQDKLSQ
ncbi:MAG: thiamine pyrophosphate-dependent enzyme, partial [Dolichospermum sp.]